MADNYLEKQYEAYELRKAAWEKERKYKKKNLTAKRPENEKEVPQGPMSIHHIAIWTFRLEELRDFYTRYFNGKSNEKYTNTRKEFERLRTDGYTIAGEPRTSGDGYFESVILDPDGNRVECVYKDE